MTRKKPNTVPPEAFGEGHVCGYRVERAFLFYSAQELDQLLQSTYKDANLKLKDLKLNLETIVEDGQELQGVLVREQTPRRVLVYTDHGTTFSRTLHKAEDTCRSCQAEEMAAWWRKDLQSTRPKSMVPGAETIQSLDAVLQAAIAAKKVEIEKEKLLKEPEAPVSEASAEPVAPPPLQAVAVKEEDADEEEEHNPVQLLLTAPSQRAGKGAGKAKAKAKSKQSKKEKGLARKLKGLGTSSQRTTAGVGSSAQSSILGADVGDGASNSGGSATPSGVSEPQKLSEALAKYTDQLSLTRVLAGDSIGHLCTNAQRALGPFKRSSPGSQEVLLLQAHIDLFKMAEKVRPSSIQKVPASERAEILKALSSDADVQFPNVSQAAILAVAIKEEEVPEKVIHMMTPSILGADDVAFNPLQPSLAATTLSEPEVVKAIARVLVEWVVPMVMAGASQKDKVRSFVTLFLETFTETFLQQVSPLVAGALQEFMAAVLGLRALIEDDLTEKGMKDFDSISRANKGPLLVLKQVQRASKKHYANHPQKRALQCCFHTFLFLA